MQTPSLAFLQEQMSDHPVMVAFAIPSGVGHQLLDSVSTFLPASAESTPLDKLHITLAYLGDATELIQVGKTREEVLLVVREFARVNNTIRGKISGVGLFTDIGDKDKSCLYASFDAPDLPALHHDLVETLEEEGISFSKEHGYTPHISLAYLDSNGNTDLSAITVPNLEIEFNSIVLAWDNTWTLIPLMGELEDKEARTVARAVEKAQKAKVATQNKMNGQAQVLGWSVKIL